VRYPVVELLTAAAFALCVAELGPSLAALKYCLFSAILITLIASDWEERILPDEFTKGGIVLGIALAALVPVDSSGLAHFFLSGWLGDRGLSIAESTFGAGVSSGSIWFVGWMYEKIRHREGLGFGDVK